MDWRMMMNRVHRLMCTFHCRSAPCGATLGRMAHRSDPTHALVSDFRFSLRTLRRRPAYAVASTLTLALGIGATTAVFAVIDATLLRPLPYPRSDRLVAVGVLSKGPDGSDTP